MNSIWTFWFYWLTKDFILATLPWKSLCLNNLWYVSGLTFLCKWFSISVASCFTLNFGLVLSQNPSIVIHCKNFLSTVPHSTNKPVFFFIPLNNMLNSGLASLDNFGYFPQRFSIVKMIKLPTDVPSMFYEHPLQIPEVQTLSLTRSDWGIMV